MTVKITQVQGSELLAMYVVNKDDLLNEGQIKGDFFIPSPKPNSPNKGLLEKSIIRYGNRDLNQMKVCGQTWASHFKLSFDGLVNFLAKDVRSVEALDVVHTPRQWELLHSDIVNWDLGVFQRVQAEELARKAQPSID